jgi:urea transport system permease protein
MRFPLPKFLSSIFLKRPRKAIRSIQMRLFLATLLGLLILVSAPAQADPLADLAAKLPDGGFSDRAARIAAIAALGDPRAISLLESLGNGELHTQKDSGRVVVVRRDGRTL